jgi:pimeloyl-ACP methyl ester carboxylesterase
VSQPISRLGTAEANSRLRRANRPSWLPAEVWPFETGMIDLDGAAIAVTDIGRGPTLLFYTGIGSFVWRDVMMRLSNDFRCVVLDPPGIGLSSPVPRSITTLENSRSSFTTPAARRRSPPPRARPVAFVASSPSIHLPGDRRVRRSAACSA